MTTDEYYKRLKLHGILSGILLASVIGLGIYFLYDFLTNKPINIKDDLSTRLFLEAKGEQPEPRTYVLSGNYIMPMSLMDLGVVILADKIMLCESGKDNSVIGKAGEIGIAQFMPRSWDYFNDLRGTKMDIYSEEDQKDMLEWCIKEGLAWHWTCYDLVKDDKTEM